MKKILHMVPVLLMAVAIQACSGGKNDGVELSKSDYESLHAYAGEYARRMVAAKYDPMELDRTILDVNVRVTQLRDELGDEAADEFRKSVGDSVRVLDAALYDAVIRE